MLQQIKGLVHPKPYLLTLMLFQTSMCLFVLLNTKEDCFNQTDLIPHWLP